MNELIKTKELSFSYNKEEALPVRVLNNINLNINKGEFVAVLGHNGSGKSTLAKMFNVILTPDEGTVYIDNIDSKDEEMLFEIRRKVGMVFQNPDNQIVATIVEQDVAFAPENLGVPPKEIRQRVDNALKQVDMYDYRDRAPHQLSGGQKQRVAIAGIIAMQPECIVLDEATAMLDPRGRKEVLNAIKSLNKDLGATIIHITHFMEEAALADRVIVMDDGKIILDDTPKKVFSHVDLLKKVGLDVPQVAELMYELHKEGIDVPLDIINKKECIDVLTRLLEG